MKTLKYYGTSIFTLTFYLLTYNIMKNLKQFLGYTVLTMATASILFAFYLLISLYI